MKLPKRSLRTITDGIWVVLAVGVFFLPAVTQTFIYGDDYGLFQESLAGELSLLANNYLRDGRPLMGIALSFTVNRFDGFEAFNWLRLVSLAGSCGLGVFLMSLFQQHRIPRLAAIIGAVTIVTAPSFALYVGWASCFLYPFSAIAALTASQILIEPMSRSVKGGKLALLLVLSVLLLLFSLTIYQITTAFSSFPTP